MKKKWGCNKCIEATFDTKEEAEAHERGCSILKRYPCDRCKAIEKLATQEVQRLKAVVDAAYHLEFVAMTPGPALDGSSFEDVLTDLILYEMGGGNIADYILQERRRQLDDDRRQRIHEAWTKLRRAISERQPIPVGDWLMQKTDIEKMKGLVERERERLGPNITCPDYAAQKVLLAYCGLFIVWRNTQTNIGRRATCPGNPAMPAVCGGCELKKVYDSPDSFDYEPSVTA